MDYRELLKKYMEIVQIEEGTTFIRSTLSGVALTDDERLELELIESEIPCYSPVPF